MADGWHISLSCHLGHQPGNECRLHRCFPQSFLLYLGGVECWVLTPREKHRWNSDSCLPLGPAPAVAHWLFWVLRCTAMFYFLLVPIYSLQVSTINISVMIVIFCPCYIRDKGKYTCVLKGKKQNSIYKTSWHHLGISALCTWRRMERAMPWEGLSGDLLVMEIGITDFKIVFCVSQVAL